MNVKLIAYGIAREIINGASMDYELGLTNPTIDDLKSALIQQFPKFGELRSLKFAVYEDYQPDSYVLNNNDEVVIIPPVSGG